jgi:multimeric flavodoxin WrbA
MKVLVILGTHRNDSNTLAAIKKKLPFDTYDLIQLHERKIEHYKYDSSKPQDDFLTIIEEAIKADTIVFATPVYWYSMSGMMKVFFDRFTDLITTSKSMGRSLQGKKTYLFATGSDDELPVGFEVPFKKTSEYFSMEFSGTTYVACKD